jgi:hypothetical protein
MTKTALVTRGSARHRPRLCMALSEAPFDIALVDLLEAERALSV